METENQERPAVHMVTDGGKYTRMHTCSYRSDKSIRRHYHSCGAGARARSPQGYVHRSKQPIKKHLGKLGDIIKELKRFSKHILDFVFGTSIGKKYCKKLYFQVSISEKL